MYKSQKEGKIERRFFLSMYLNHAVGFCFCFYFTYKSAFCYCSTKIQVSSTAREAKRAKLRFKLYSYYAWGLPILLVSGGHLSEYLEPLQDYSPEYATNYCWINSQSGLAMFFALPIGTLLLENAIFIGISVICLLRNHRQAFIQSNDIHKYIRKL